MFNWLTGAFAEEAAEAAETVAEAAAETTEAAQAAVEQSSYVTDTLLKKLLGADMRFWLMILGLAALAAIFLAIAKSRKAWSAKTVAYGALAIALSFVLSYIRLFRMPQGGSITPASMLPMMIFSAAFGIGPGVAAGLVYGVLQYLQGGDFLNIWQVLFDYVIAFSALGLAGLYKYLNKKWQVYAVLGVSAVLLILMCIGYPTIWWVYVILLAAMAVLAFFVIRDPDKYGMLPAMGIAVLGRACSAIIAGLMWVAAYPVEGQAPFIYSMIYNGAYLIPELVICMALAGILGKRLISMMKTGR